MLFYTSTAGIARKPTENASPRYKISSPPLGSNVRDNAFSSYLLLSVPDYCNTKILMCKKNIYSTGNCTFDAAYRIIDTRMLMAETTTLQSFPPVQNGFLISSGE